jgi:hypothetical protein
MNVTLQYFNGCPNWKITDDRLRELLGTDTAIEYRLVESQEDAEQLEFRGSPTILVEGIDPFASSDEPVGLACRMYLTAEGREGAPSMDQLRSALGMAS